MGDVTRSETRVRLTAQPDDPNPDPLTHIRCAGVFNWCGWTACGFTFAEGTPYANTCLIGHITDEPTTCFQCLRLAQP